MEGEKPSLELAGFGSKAKEPQEKAFRKSAEDSNWNAVGDRLERSWSFIIIKI